MWRALPAPPGAGGLASVRASAERVDAFLDAELDHYRLGADRAVIVGFSQGAMMAMHVALRRAQPVAGVLGYSGNLAAPELLIRELRTRPTTLLVHGGMDHLMPVQTTLDAAGALRSAGVTVRTEIVPGVAQAIDDRGIALGAAFLMQVLG
jgi:phospholipase/carboxylesterase